MTRGDVFVDCRSTVGVAHAGVADPRRWGTWFAMDGGDTADTLTSSASLLGRAGTGGDVCAALNRQVEEVQSGYWFTGPDGRGVRFRCFLTGFQGPKS